MNDVLILIVEDDTAVRNLMAVTMETHNYRYLTSTNGNQALKLCSEKNPDIILLDLGLPDMDGIEVIRKIRTWSNVPIVVISARSEDIDKIEALDAGADDYLTKPFSVEELLARLRATTRRLAFMRSADEEKPFFDNGKLHIDYLSAVVSVNGNEVHLTQTEFRLLVLLAKNMGRVLTYQFITQKIWGSCMDSDVASLRVFIRSLRKKIESDDHTTMIQTHIGIGYRMLRID